MLHSKRPSPPAVSNKASRLRRGAKCGGRMTPLVTSRILPTLHWRSAKGHCSGCQGIAYLKLFTTSNWVVATKGRAAVLQLRGDLGALDVWSIYLHASAPKARIDTMRTMGRLMGPQDRCLSVLAGDWNFTTHAHDRYAKTHSTWTGDKQKEDANALLTSLVNGKGCQ